MIEKDHQSDWSPDREGLLFATKVSSDLTLKVATTQVVEMSVANNSPSDLTLKMASTQVVKTSVAHNSPSQYTNHPGDLLQSRYEVIVLAFLFPIHLILISVLG